MRLRFDRISDKGIRRRYFYWYKVITAAPNADTAAFRYKRPGSTTGYIEYSICSSVNGSRSKIYVLEGGVLCLGLSSFAV